MAKYKVGDKVRVRSDLQRGDGTGCSFAVEPMLEYRNKIATIKDARKAVRGNYTIYTFEGDECGWCWTDEMLEPADNIVRMADGTIIGDFSTGGFCDGFRGGKKPADVDGGLVSIHDVDTHELWTTPFIIPKDRLDALVDAWAKLGCTTFNLVPDEVKEVIKKTEEKKMPTKFTFYVIEGTRVDKSCNGTIPTMTTIVEANSYSRTAPVGTATCDKADYDMRQGVLEALANMYCDGDFDKVFNKAVKRNELADKKKRTCTYCGQLFDTVEEKQAHEAWHIERKKARRERYLLRKRAKEIAFEEQAQKMAKEMIEK